MNELEYRIAGVRRSGIHAVATWIFEQFRGRRVLFNDVHPRRDPWKVTANVVVPDSAPPLGIHEPKDCLMLIFEDRHLEAVSNSDLLRFVGPSKRVHTALVLRDPFNLLASRLRWTQKTGAAAALTDPTAGRDLWLEYAREFAGKSTVLPSAVWVNYNRWVTQPPYRNAIGRRLILPEPWRSTEKVPFFGGGSSFDGRQYDGKASQMRLFTRWRPYLDSPQFLRLIDHPELLDLSARIFGTRPFEELYDRLGALR